MGRTRIVDVFGGRDFSGNALAVIDDPAVVDTAEMLRITRWFGFSETTFLLPPTDPSADYRVRIFTLSGELPFAGHPTLGTCHAWLEAGGVPKADVVVQECAAGLVPIRRHDGQLAFAAPPLLRSGPIDAALLDEIASFLGVAGEAIVDSQWVDNGPGWVAVLLDSADAVLAVTPPASHPRDIKLGVVGPHRSGPAAYEVRAFFSNDRRAILEDPVTGSLNASLAQWLTGSGRFTPPYLARQGTAMGREGQVSVERGSEGRLWIGGRTLTIVAG